MAYDFYLDAMLLPVTPSKLTISIDNKNKTMVLINDGEINILKKPGLTDISFTALLPQTKYPFAVYKNGFQKADVFLDKLEQLKTSQKPFQFIVSRTFPNGKLLFDTNIKVSLEDYKIIEDSKNGFDVNVEIKLKQYRDYGSKTVNVTIKQSKPVATVQNTRPAESSPAPKVTAKSYTVAKGDTLWAIAKKYYGDGSKYTKIFEANKGVLKNPNVIYPGQVLALPV
ncbi:MAG TPA: LysM peptidoglycan-binding domain-containing protein [Fervidobacterium sp.]|nr:LysM peptidoglycan-binding domain-containing protein [Thermodesulfovibrio thiophilus]HUM42435.1 LysM peptidoglycan-binding domain-containing protein [Fervidobacterium sp.]